MVNHLILSNCLLEALKFKVLNPAGHVKCDTNSPSGGVSFFFEYGNQRIRFRRKLRLRSNKSKILFYGYRVIEKLDADNKVVSTCLSSSNIHGYQVKRTQNKLNQNNMENLPFNHEVESPMKACSINERELPKKYAGFIESTNSKTGDSVSYMVEDMEKRFTTREIAFIATQKILGEVDMQARIWNFESIITELMEAFLKLKSQAFRLNSKKV
jgi:hypothetical protein